MVTDQKVPLRQRVWAGALVIIGVLPMVISPSFANALAMCGILLVAWREAFYVSPSARMRLRDVYAGYREGRFTSDRIGRLVGTAGILLIVASFVVRLNAGT